MDAEDKQFLEVERGIPNKESHRAFVAMSFDHDLDVLFADGIQPGARPAEFLAERVDNHPHVNRIDDEIIAMLPKSHFCIADFTQQKCGVYFEAGFAKGMGIPVVWCCEEEESQQDSLRHPSVQFHHMEPE